MRFSSSVISAFLSAAAMSLAEAFQVNTPRVTTATATPPMSQSSFGVTTKNTALFVSSIDTEQTSTTTSVGDDIENMPRLMDDGIFDVNNADEHAALMKYAEDKLVILKVFAPWCRACKGLEPKFQRLVHEKEYNDGVPIVWAQLSIQHNKQFIQSLGVLALPTVQFYVGGKLLDTFPCGPSKVPILKRKLTALIQDHVDSTTGTIKPESVIEAAEAAEQAALKVKEAAAKREAAKREKEEREQEKINEQKMSPEEYGKLQRIPYFASMSLADLDSVVDKAIKLTFQPGSVILKEGKPGQMFYIITDGEVEILQQTINYFDPMVQNAVPDASSYLGTVINTLGPWNYFGERSLILGEPRAASIRVADKPVTVWAFDKDNFPHSCPLSGRSTSSALALMTEVNDKYGLSLSEYEQQVIAKQLRESATASQVRGSVYTTTPLDDDSTVSSVDTASTAGSIMDESSAVEPPIPSIVTVGSKDEDAIFSLLSRFQMIRHVTACFKYIQETRAVWGDVGTRKRRNMLVSRLSPSLRSEFHEIFHIMDSNGDGSIQLSELKRLMDSVGEEQTEEQLKQSFMGNNNGNNVGDTVSINGSSGRTTLKKDMVMTYEDYMGLMAEAEFYNLFTDIFSSLDEKKSGYVKARELDRVLCGVRDLISDDRKSVIDVDDKDMLIDYEQFSRMLLGTNLI